MENATEVAEAACPIDTAAGSSNGPVVDVMDVQGQASSCLKRKRSSRNKQSNAKKQKMSAKDSGSTSAASSQPSEDNEAVIISSSLISDGNNHSRESCSVENREERCLLDTFTGMLQL